MRLAGIEQTCSAAYSQRGAPSERIRAQPSLWDRRAVRASRQAFSHQRETSWEKQNPKVANASLRSHRRGLKVPPGRFGEAVRGSNALTGAVDIIVELERSQSFRDPTMRVLKAVSRSRRATKRGPGSLDENKVA
jgi:hypothetical protein